MCEYCKKTPGVGWTKQKRFINTEEEFRTINSQKIWSTHNRDNSIYAIIRDYAGIAPKHEGGMNGDLHIKIPEIDESVTIEINYCPFCGHKLGDMEPKHI